MGIQLLLSRMQCSEPELNEMKPHFSPFTITIYSHHPFAHHHPMLLSPASHANDERGQTPMALD